MSKFTIGQRKTVKGLVLQAVCEQQTLESISKFVKEESGLEISLDEADRIRKAFRKEARTWLSVLVKSNYEYLAEYRERINAVKYSIRRANELYRQPPTIKRIPTHKKVKLDWIFLPIGTAKHKMIHKILHASTF